MRKEIRKAGDNVEQAVSLLKRISEREAIPNLVKQKSQEVIKTLEKCMSEIGSISNMYL